MNSRGKERYLCQLFFGVADHWKEELRVLLNDHRLKVTFGSDVPVALLREEVWRLFRNGSFRPTAFHFTGGANTKGHYNRKILLAQDFTGSQKTTEFFNGGLSKLKTIVCFYGNLSQIVHATPLLGRVNSHLV